VGSDFCGLLPLSSVDAPVAGQIRPTRKGLCAIFPDTFVGALGRDGAFGVRGALVSEVILTVVVQVDIQVQIKIVAVWVVVVVVVVVAAVVAALVVVWMSVLLALVLLPL